jgi:hypothetical protein
VNVKAFDAYRSRFLKLLEYIDANLEENLRVDELSIVAPYCSILVLTTISIQQ